MKNIIATLLAAAILLSITAVAVSAAVRKDTEMKRADLINTITDRINEITKTKEAKKADAAAKETQAEETS